MGWCTSCPRWRLSAWLSSFSGVHRLLAIRVGDELPMSKPGSAVGMAAAVVSASAPARAATDVHRSGRSSWIRAAVLGSDDAIVSTASLMLGIAATAASRESTLLAGLAGLVAGSMSMAVGEYVSVSSQRDAERADVRLERKELLLQPKAELRELAQIYVSRGLEPGLALKVAAQLSARDRLGAHLRDELGIDASNRARPFGAAAVSAASFASFATVPILALLLAPAALRPARRPE